MGSLPIPNQGRINTQMGGVLFQVAGYIGFNQQRIQFLVDNPNCLHIA